MDTQNQECIGSAFMSTQRGMHGTLTATVSHPIYPIIFSDFVKIVKLFDGTLHYYKVLRLMSVANSV